MESAHVHLLGFSSVREACLVMKAWGVLLQIRQEHGSVGRTSFSGVRNVFAGLVSVEAAS